MKKKPKIAKLLLDLGFVRKPWKTYTDIWWFNGHPLMSISGIRKPSDIVNVCLASFTPEAKAYSDMTESVRKESALKSIRKLI